MPDLKHLDIQVRRGKLDFQDKVGFSIEIEALREISGKLKSLKEKESGCLQLDYGNVTYIVRIIDNSDLVDFDDDIVITKITKDCRIARVIPVTVIASILYNIGGKAYRE